MGKTAIVKLVTDFVLGDAITPQLPRLVRLGALLVGAPLGMVLGAAMCWLGIW